MLRLALRRTGAAAGNPPCVAASASAAAAVSRLPWSERDASSSAPDASPSFSGRGPGGAAASFARRFASSSRPADRDAPATLGRGGKERLTLPALLARLHAGDPAVLALGRDKGTALVNLLMRARPEDLADPAGDGPAGPGRRRGGPAAAGAAARAPRGRPSAAGLAPHESWVAEWPRDERGDRAGASPVWRKRVARVVDPPGADGPAAASRGRGARKSAVASAVVAEAPGWDSLERTALPSTTVNGVPHDAYFADPAQAGRGVPRPPSRPAPSLARPPSLPPPDLSPAFVDGYTVVVYAIVIFISSSYIYIYIK